MPIGGISRPPKVVVTGLGLASGLGTDARSTWEAIQQGRSCLVRLPGSGLIGGPAANPDDPEPCSTILASALIEALATARVDRRSLQGSERVAILIGQSKGRVRTLTQSFQGRSPAEDWPLGWPDSGSIQVQAILGSIGPLFSPVAACATGLVAVLQGVNLIQWGEADLAIAGAVDASLEPLLLAAFRNMKVLARHEDPARAVRPWDSRRNGFAVGEGGAVFVLERADRAEARGVRPIAEVAGGALGGDGHHITDQDPDPANLAGLIERALDRAGVAPSEIDHVNVHGTATRSNDPLECRAIRRALGRFADRVSCSASKAQIGHLLGAAGAAELAVACLAIRDQFAPPTINLDDPDPACDLDGTPHVGKPRDIRAALKISLGFGGHLAVAVLKRPS